MMLIKVVRYMAYITLILFAVLLACRSEAREFHILELNELSVDYKNYAALNDKARNTLIYPEHPKEGINVNIRANMLRYFYFEPTIESLTTGAQYKSIGLQLGLGLRLTSWLEGGYWHHSQHILDGKQAYMDKFPSEDAIAVKVYLYRVDKCDNCLLQ